jgi:hypothetical protein
MPNKYVFKSDKTDFSCRLECQQCEAITSKGTPCKRRTCLDRQCFQHLLQSMNLRIKTSLLPGVGNGLFAMWSNSLPESKASYLNHTTPIFKKSDVVAFYGGEIIQNNVFNERYGDETGNGPYTIELSIAHPYSLMLDGACKRTAGVMANDTRGHDGKTYNVEFVYRQVRLSDYIDPNDKAKGFKAFMSGVPFIGRPEANELVTFDDPDNEIGGSNKKRKRRMIQQKQKQKQKQNDNRGGARRKQTKTVKSTKNTKSTKKATTRRRRAPSVTSSEGSSAYSVYSDREEEQENEEEEEEEQIIIHDEDLILPIKRKIVLILQATCDIFHGQEIYANYGNSYWSSSPPSV